MRRIVAIGNVLYVYLILGMLAMIFGSNTPTGMYLMKNLFFDDVYIMILAFIIFGAVWLAMNIVFLTLVVVGKLKYEAFSYGTNPHDCKTSPDSGIYWNFYYGIIMFANYFYIWHFP